MSTSIGRWLAVGALLGATLHGGAAQACGGCDERKATAPRHAPVAKAKIGPRRKAIRFLAQWAANGEPADHPFDVRSTKTFDPLTALIHHNGGSGLTEIVVAGLEGLPGYRRPVVKVFQPGQQAFTRFVLPRSVTELANPVVSNGAPYELREQGFGVAGKNLVIAGGQRVGATSNYGSSNTLFLVNARSQKVTRLPDLKEARTLPMVGSSPGGSRILIAGGFKTAPNRGTYETSAAIEIFDRATGQYLDVEAHYPGLATGMKGRTGGKVVWVKRGGTERIFFIGGTRKPAWDHDKGEPTQEVDVYDVPTKSWLKVVLPNATMNPGVAIRELGDGTQEIVIAGGNAAQIGTGGHVLRDQLYAVQRLDPHSLKFTTGGTLPTQPTLREGSHAIAAGGTALVFQDAHEPGGGAISTDAHAIGFSRAYHIETTKEELPTQLTINNIHVENTDVETHIETTHVTNVVAR